MRRNATRQQQVRKNGGWAPLVLLALASSACVCGFLPVSTTTGSSGNRNPVTAKTAATGSRSGDSALFAVGDQGNKSSKRVRFMNRLGFRRASKDNYEVRQNNKHTRTQEDEAPASYNVTSLDELDAYWADEQRRFRKDNGEIDYDDLLKSLSVEGDTQIIGSPEHPSYVHPVARIIHERKRTNSPYIDSTVTSNTTRDDGCRVALAIEGGGMRGCISAGMICAIHHLNLTSAFDVVYGSSAGTIIGTYLVTGQLPWFGPEVYYDCLTTAGRSFIDTKRLLRALGFGLLDPRLLKDVLTRPSHGKPVLNLPYLLNTTVQNKKRVDWEKFVEKQKFQPLKVVASACKSEKAIAFDMESKSFETLPEFAQCMHASCLLPGIAGPLMNFDTRSIDPRRRSEVTEKFVLGNNIQDENYEPLADALLFEPLPYRSAIAEGATHVVVIRSRPDGTDVTGKGGIFERLIFRRFFLRKNRLPRIFKRLKMQLHKKLYAEDVIRLNDEADSDRYYKDTSKPHLMAIALPPGSEEIARLETGREAIFEGMRRGFARAYDALVEDPAERGRGAEVAKQYFPDEILDYDPLAIDESEESAYSIYMRQRGVSTKSGKAGSEAASRTIKAAYPLR